MGDQSAPRRAVNVPGGPLANVVAASDRGGPRSIGVIGLGAGSMAAYAEPGDEVTFYEIDPAVIELALDPDVFSFLADSAGATRVVAGGGRLSIAAAGDAVHDLVVIDAFSSDAIPVHLLTREAVATYRRALISDGMLAFHVSNRYFDLFPVVARLASDAGLVALAERGPAPSTAAWPPAQRSSAPRDRRWPPSGQPRGGG